MTRLTKELSYVYYFPVGLSWPVVCRTLRSASSFYDSAGSKSNCPITGLERPLELQEVEYSRISRQSAHEGGRLSAIHPGCLYSTGDIQGTHTCFEAMLPLVVFVFRIVLVVRGPDRGSTVVKVLCYKLECRWFDPSWCHWNFSLT